MRGAQVAVFLLVCGFLVLSNHFDWDFFFSFDEVERRSWLDDLTPRRWSYQACAGITRIADPQSLGSSPLFVLVLLFGTFWDTKLMVAASLAYGLHASGELLRVFDSRDASEG